MASACQLFLVGLAVWGLFFSTAGEKIIAGLRSDVQDARGSLADLRAQRTMLDGEVRTQQSILSDSQLKLLSARQQLGILSQQKETISHSLADVSNTLNAQQEQLRGLRASYKIAAPSMRGIVCERVSSIASRSVLAVTLEGGLTPYRWKLFLASSGLVDETNWKKVLDAFENWKKENTPADGFKKTEISGADYPLELVLEEQAQWHGENEKNARAVLKGLVKDTPRNLSYDIGSIYAQPLGTLDSVERINPWMLIHRVFAADELSKIDPEYRAWLLEYEAKIEQYKSSLDYQFPRIYPKNTVYSAVVEDLSIRYLRMLDAVDAISNNNSSFCRL